MADNWDDSDDEWDVGSDNEELDKRLGLKNVNKFPASAVFDDEEDLAVKEKAIQEKLARTQLRTKGNALAEKKKAEQERKEEEELARKTMEMESEMEANMTEEDRKLLQKRRVEEADNALTDDLFGGVDDVKSARTGGGKGNSTNVSENVIMKDLKDHLKHARKVAQCIKGHGKVHLASAFLKECINECKDVLDDDETNELIKTLNVIKNEKMAAAKRKVKGQAQKAGKKDKKAEAKAKMLQVELFGDNDNYDNYDEYGAQYEDDFF